MKFRSIFWAMLLMFGCVSIASAQTGKNVLFFGNSFTLASGFGSSQSLVLMFRNVAVAAGQPTPRPVQVANGGWSLLDHLNSTQSLGWINSGLTSSSANWDAVVLQDYSTMPTHIGNLAQHRSTFKSLYDLVKARSPNVKAVGFETWARGYGHEFYSGATPSFANPAAMQAELRAGYALSTADLNAFYGAGTSSVAPVGDAWQALNFNSSLYASDIYHASSKGTLLDALVLYGRIYNDRTIADINLSSILTQLGLSAADGQQLAFAAESVLPEPTSLTLIGLVLVTTRRHRGA